eukprot:gb/GECG01011661.1/.p1 GENE.gb/GECG01011661.1/~~gb/GECG01011661.1/.p1  ORF type:complete len:169 (+),score=6.40 gb/GECG01011661.1/:1-507(+)
MSEVFEIGTDWKPRCHTRSFHTVPCTICKDAETLFQCIDNFPSHFFFFGWCLGHQSMDEVGDEEHLHFLGHFCQRFAILTTSSLLYNGGEFYARARMYCDPYCTLHTDGPNLWMENKTNQLLELLKRQCPKLLTELTIGPILVEVIILADVSAVRNHIEGVTYDCISK